jgi:hypothetical protein
MGNNEQDIATAKNISLQIGGLDLKEDKIAVLALTGIGVCGKQVTVDAKGNIKMKPTKLYPKIDGVLGSEFFERFVVEIDYDKKRLIIYDPKTYHYHGKGRSYRLKSTDTTSLRMPP